MRDPLVTPAVGDVIEGHRGGCAYRWTVRAVTEYEVTTHLVVTYPDGSTDDDGVVCLLLENGLDWSGYRDVHPVPPPRDPLVDPEPGDVVRAKSGGIPAVVVVLDAAEGLVGYVVCWPGHREATVYEETLDEWRDWSAWTDVAVLS